MSPGHIDFIKNMLAGVGGIDAALLVIAADEGVMPQTREHLAILDLLAVPAGVVALTKVDLVDDPEWLDLVELEISELLQGTRLQDAPLFRVSATRDDGLAALRNGLAATLTELAPRRNRDRPRLPIDRMFSLSGFGTVVTGTLSDGGLDVGDVVEILPPRLTARIRGMQTHKQQIIHGEPGSRVAINLSGVGTDELHRGDVIVKPNTLQPTQLVDVSFRHSADASKPITHNQTVDLFSGAAEVPARVRLLGATTLEPGAEGWLQLRLEKPLVVALGDRYILRQPSPSATLGGGVILNPHPRRRWRRFDTTVIDRLRTLAKGAPDEILLHTLERRPFLSEKELIAQSGLDLKLAQEAFAELQASDALTRLETGQEPVYLTEMGWGQALRRLTDLVALFHQQSPLRRGMPRGELRSRLQGSLITGQLSVRLFNAWVEGAQANGYVEADDSHVWQTGFHVTLSQRQETLINNVMDMLARAGYAPPASTDVLDRLDHDEALLDMLVEQGALVRLGGGLLFRNEEFSAMLAQIQDHIQEHGSITLATTRDLFDTSRKYAQAILEEMDVRRLTRRDGDVRVLRNT